MIEERINVKGTVGLDTVKIYPITQEKIVVPTKEIQEILPDEKYDSLSKVMVKPIPDEYVIPNGKIEIKDNGSYDVTDKATAKIGVPMPTGTLDITSNGNYNVKDKEFANVNVPEKQLGTKTITTNGTYKATDDNLDGYSEVNVETSGVDINEYFTSALYRNVGTSLQSTIKKIPSNLDISKITNMSNFFRGCYNLTEIPLLDTSNVTAMDSTFDYCTSLITIPLLDTSNVTAMGNMFGNCISLKYVPKLNTSKTVNMYSMFENCENLQEIPLLDTSNVWNMQSFASGCKSLTSFPQIDTSKVTGMNNMLRICDKLVTVPQLNAQLVTSVSYILYLTPNLQDFGGLLNLGQAYSTSQSANYSSYNLILSVCPKLTHESLMNVINGLYDIKTKGCNPQGLALGATNLAKLTSEEIAIATEKGWNVS